MKARLAVLSLGLLLSARGALDAQQDSARCAPAAGEGDSAVVTQVAVAGFMVSAGGRTLIIDALHRHPQHAPPPATLEKLEQASPPFDAIDLVLVSHSHGDHFDRRSVAEHLLHNPRAVVVSGQLVYDQLAELPEFERFGDRVIAVAPEPGAVVALEANGIPMKVFRLSHGERGGDYSMDNLGMLADLCGTKIFNTGDIAPVGQTEVIGAARLAEDRIDIAFLAFTVFYDEEFPEAAAVVEMIKPRHIVVSHLYERHFGEFTEHIAARYPNAIILTSKGESKVIR